MRSNTSSSLLFELSKDTPLHKAAQNADAQAIKLLLKNKADVNIKNTKGKTPLESVIDIAIKTFNDRDNEKHRKMVDKYVDIVGLLLQYGAIFPTNTNLVFLFVKQPDVNVIEVYSKEKKAFLEYLPSHYQTIRDSKKDAVILFFAKQDHTPDSPNFSAMIRYYDEGFLPAIECYEGFAENFIVFRVLIDNILKIPECTFIIKKSLSPDQEIKHVMLNAHSNNRVMLFGNKDNEFSYLTCDDWKNNFAMKKTCALLSKDATVALSGCETGFGKNNITKQLSVVAGGRVLFGANNVTQGIKYTYYSHAKDQIPWPFFYAKSDNFAKVYRKGKEIANCSWPRAKL